MDRQLDKKDALRLLPKRIQDSNKATYGRILNIAGSRFYQGAAFLSSISALKVGAGYSTLACPDCIINNIASMTPDLTFLPLRTFNNESIASDNAKIVIDQISSFKAVSLGCGLTTNSSTIEFIDKFLKGYNSEVPIVIDADGLNAISLLGLDTLPHNVILTPHPKELSRLLNIETDEINNNREHFAKMTAQKFKATVVLKGHKTVIADKYGDVYTNITGNSSLAKAGSGDVLTGIITGLLAQRLKLTEAAALGVFIHGLSGELASQDNSQYGVLASNLIDYIPKAINQILFS